MDDIKHFKKLSKLDKNYFLNSVKSVVLSIDNILLKEFKGQLESGENADGSIIGTYTKLTEEYASLDNPIKPKREGKPYNLQWTGDLFKKMYVSVEIYSQDVSLWIDSNSKNKFSLFETLKSKGKDPKKIYGFQSETKDKLAKEIANNINLKLKKDVL